MKPEEMTNEQLAAAVDEMFNSPDFDAIKFEAARRLREYDTKLAEQPKRPERAVRVIIEIGGDTWADVLADLSHITDQADRDGRVRSGVMGGPSSGNMRTVIENPEMTNEKYHAALDAYLAARKPADQERPG